MLDNSWKLDGLLTGDKSEVVKAGLEACLPEVAPDEPAQTLSQRYADALVELARRALQNVPTTGRPSADVTLLLTSRIMCPAASLATAARTPAVIPRHNGAKPTT